MKRLPKTQQALVLRADFSDNTGWETLCAEIQKPVGDFRAYVDFINDPAYDQITVEQLLALDPKSSNHWFMFMVDRIAITHPEHPILVVDFNVEPGRMFRVLPLDMWGVENNLSLSNMDFAEFADCVDQNEIFREDLIH
jgi:hypothetical protein